MTCIFSDIEESLVVVGPGDTGHALDSFRKDLAGSQIFDLKRVLAIAGVVSAVGEQVAIVARNEAADAHELLALRQFILIEHDLFRRVEAAFLATEDRILFTFLSARVIEVISRSDKERWCQSV